MASRKNFLPIFRFCSHFRYLSDADIDIGARAIQRIVAGEKTSFMEVKFEEYNLHHGGEDQRKSVQLLLAVMTRNSGPVSK